MDIKDQNAKISQAKMRFNEAREDLRQSYDKNLKETKETYENRFEDQAEVYSAHKSKLEEQNKINNEYYSDKTKEAINKGQEDFKARLKENISKFEADKNKTRNELNDKLSSVSEAYKKSFAENDRTQAQVKKSMGDRYSSANKKYQEVFNNQVNSLESKTKNEVQNMRNNHRSDLIKISDKHNQEIDNLRNSAGEEKNLEINRLSDDNENLRTTFERENIQLKDRQDERISEFMRLKENESEEAQKNYQNLQQDIRKKDLEGQERQNLAHKLESKNLEKTFNDNIRTIQRVADQKIKGGSQATNLNDELKQTKENYENRLKLVRDELEKNNANNIEKEQKIEANYRYQARANQDENSENLNKLEDESTQKLNQSISKNREKNNILIDKYKLESTQLKKDAEDRLATTSNESSLKLKDQRVEFGRVVNSLNEKNIETINTIKDEYSKDRSIYIEKSKKDFNEEKVAMKNEFNRQNSLKESIYEQRLGEMEKKTSKIIDNYENKLSQIARKAEMEIDAIKSQIDERQFKEDQSTKVALDTIQKKNDSELIQLRDKYEHMIAKDRVMGEQKANRIIQKYEDQLIRERQEATKELNMRTAEAQSQLERLYKSSEMEKETLINQYEQRIENMQLETLSQGHSKKS